MSQFFGLDKVKGLTRRILLASTSFVFPIKDQISFTYGPVLSIPNNVYKLTMLYIYIWSLSEI
jgi:hypothetical protein